MMQYTQLTDAQLGDIRRQKLLEIEAEHARLSLDLKLADAVGMKTDAVAVGKANLSLLERQHRHLSDMLAPPTVASNGSDPLPARVH